MSDKRNNEEVNFSSSISNLESQSDMSSTTSFEESASEMSSRTSEGNEEMSVPKSPRKGRPPKDYNYTLNNQFQGFPNQYPFHHQQQQYHQQQQHQPGGSFRNPYVNQQDMFNGGRNPYSPYPQYPPYNNMQYPQPPQFIDIRKHYNMEPNPFFNNPYNSTPYSPNMSYNQMINESQHPSVKTYNKLSKTESYESLIEKTRLRREQDREKSFRKSHVEDSESVEFQEEETITEVDFIEKILCIIKYNDEVKCLVKRRFHSYLHNFWCDLEEMSTQSNMLKYKSFLKKTTPQISKVNRKDLEETELFNISTFTPKPDNTDTPDNTLTHIPDNTDTPLDTDTKELKDIKDTNILAEIEIWKSEPPLEPDLLEIERIICINSPQRLGIDFDFADETEGLVYDGLGGCSFLFPQTPKPHEDTEYKDTELSKRKVVYLIKWKGLNVDLSTFEEYSFIYKLKGFKEALKTYKKRENHRPCEKSVYERPKVIEKKEIKKFESINHTSNIKDTNDKNKKMELRSYQLEGLNWLLNRWYYNQSCIMADEMGLGKTVQSVALIKTIFDLGYTNKILIVTPLSTIPHWEREFLTWSNLNITILHGNKEGRDVLLHYDYPTSDIIITTYEMAMCSLKPEKYGTYGVGIFDEAHRLKNANSKATKFFSKLTFGFKLLLSGTPLQNNLSELWSLLNFIDPIKFPSVNDFLRIYKLEKSEDVERLQNTLRPLMLRRMKDDVETIPVKEETVVEVELTMIQKRFYKAILYKNRAYFQNNKKSNEPSFVNIMMELRKCCIHPFLIKGAEEIILNDKSYTESISKYVDSEYYNILIQSSGKLVFLDKLLNKMFKEKSGKILIFSQMTKCLDLIGMYLKHKNYNFERIDGSVRKELRQESIDRFSNNSIEDSFVFLLCTRAGGVGINLTAANTCVIFDSDWNPQNDLQAQARCHRIGQTQSVKIYRLVTRNTYEREMFDRASIKLGLDRAVLQKDLKQSFNEINTIESLLKKGAYGILMENDSINLNFVSEDIEKMLSNRTKVISHERNAGHIFSKASFGVEEEINDERFWDDLLSEKRNKERDLQIRKQLRRLAREGDLLKEDRIYKKVCEEIISEFIKLISAGNDTPHNETTYNETTYNDTPQEGSCKEVSSITDTLNDNNYTTNDNNNDNNDIIKDLSKINKEDIKEINNKDIKEINKEDIKEINNKDIKEIKAGEVAILLMLYVLRNGVKSLGTIKEICGGIELVSLIPKLNSLVAGSIDPKYQSDYLVNLKTESLSPCNDSDINTNLLNTNSEDKNKEILEDKSKNKKRQKVSEIKDKNLDSDEKILKNIKEDKEGDKEGDIKEDIKKVKEENFLKEFMQLTTKDLEKIKTKIILPENFSRSQTGKNLNTNILKTFNHFYLLRLQAYNLLKDYTNKMSLIYQKGATLKEDEELVKYTLENGYDNYPTSVYENNSKLFKGKKPEELNQRIRKILLCLHSQIHAVDLNEIALNFGPINDFNKEFIKKECSLDSYNLFLNEIIKKGDDLLLTRHEKKLRKIKNSGYSLINENEKKVYWRYRLFSDAKVEILKELKEGINKYFERTGNTINEIEKLMKNK